ncbi:hypothetical protein GCM10010399_64320 [Dactylosporangium fulvum]|uniref:DUF6308 family protein n=1 Tax=Dactylosporangium fulvum TaxID=53359 RepID=A0ABY5W951_9ACTN|nr:DUF6308 family protein [Dactylosporangium fulvum]UWP85744.1 DUF6308 family protein [Dactylosporangium fulvum]
MPEKLIDIAEREGVVHLEAYFAPRAYTGQWFETFAGGGDRAETRDRITAEDLYAVEALNVQVPFVVGRDLIEGQLGRDVGFHLREIPTDVELGGRGGGELVADNGHADQAWRLLNNRNEKTGVGWVIAGKLLARKRPKLIPVYDSIVSCQFRASQHVWMKLHRRLAENEGSLRAVLAAARATVGADDKVSVLRALDVILWRRHVKDHWRDKPAACPKRGTVEL